jgi:hypothetical protein
MTSLFWPTALLHRSLGYRPRTEEGTGRLAESHIHLIAEQSWGDDGFQPTGFFLTPTCGVATGYGEKGLRPNAPGYCQILKSLWSCPLLSLHVIE